jgi:hypothetical protein
VFRSVIVNFATVLSEISSAKFYITALARQNRAAWSRCRRNVQLAGQHQRGRQQRVVDRPVLAAVETAADAGLVPAEPALPAHPEHDDPVWTGDGNPY